MISKFIFALAPVGAILVLSEILWRRRVIKGEQARKFIHVLAGCWMAFWPFYIPFDGIFVLGCMALTLILYSRTTRLFHAIYSVKRRTYGDVLYALALIICAYGGQQDWIFTTSVLLLALADGAAAAAGYYWGARNGYRVFGQAALQKSVAGTAAFLVFAYVSVGIGWILGGQQALPDAAVAFFVFLPIGATLVENSMPYGFDNLAVPVFATLLLNSLL